MVILDIIQLVAVIILFIITIKQKKELNDRDLEIHALSVELDTLKLNQSRQELKLTEIELQVFDEVKLTLNKKYFAFQSNIVKKRGHYPLESFKRDSNAFKCSSKAAFPRSVILKVVFGLRPTNCLWLSM